MCPDCPHCEGSSNPCQDSFGSVAEPMGGFAGRTDAVFGAKECQKTNGSLHIHFFAFIQRLHQYCNMVEIAERLEKALVNATDLKNFINHICCTTYPDVDKFEEERAELEKHFPTYAESQEHQAAGQPRRCGECRLGLIPAFVRRDASSPPGVAFTQLYPTTGCTYPKRTKDVERNIQVEVEREAKSYKTQFLQAQQFYQSRCQYHIHKMDAKTGQRSIPNACQCKSRPRECKHEAPWIERLNHGDPLLVCKGIAETKGLRSSGSRNWLSAILPTRNEAWLNGTHPGFLIAFAGSNSDTKPNDRLPIIECTHESICSKKCVKKTIPSKPRS